MRPSVELSRHLLLLLRSTKKLLSCKKVLVSFASSEEGGFFPFSRPVERGEVLLPGGSRRRGREKMQRARLLFFFSFLFTSSSFSTTSQNDTDRRGEGGRGRGKRRAGAEKRMGEKGGRTGGELKNPLLRLRRLRFSTRGEKKKEMEAGKTFTLSPTRKQHEGEKKHWRPKGAY